MLSEPPNPFSVVLFVVLVVCCYCYCAPSFLTSEIRQHLDGECRLLMELFILMVILHALHTAFHHVVRLPFHICYYATPTDHNFRHLITLFIPVGKSKKEKNESLETCNVYLMGNVVI